MTMLRVNDVGSFTLNRVSKILSVVPNGAIKAVSRAMKRAGESGKTEAAGAAAGVYTISQGTFRSNTKVNTRVWGGGGAISMSITFTGRTIPLLEFDTKYAKGGLVRTRIMRGGTVTPLAHAFVANIYGGLGVFERVGKPRFPVRKLMGPSTGHMMANTAVSDKVSNAIGKTFEARVDHEVSRLLNG